jgi:phosphonate transport system permease protein
MSNVKGSGLFKPQEFTLSNKKEISSKFPIGTYITIAIFILMLVAGQITGFSFRVLARQGLEFFTIPRRMVPIDLEYIPKVIPPLAATIQMSILGSFIGSVFAFPVAFLASSNINKNQILLTVTRMILTIFRTLPVLVYASIFTVIFGFGTFAGTISIMLFTFAIVTKILYDNIETIDLGAYEALLATGCTKTKAIITAIFPQVMPTFFSTALYSFEINIRYSAILGYVGAGGIGLLISEKLGWREYTRFGTIFVGLFIVVLSIESLSQYLRRRLA